MVPPTGYNLSDEVYEAEVNSTGTGFVPLEDEDYVNEDGLLTIVDLPLSRISVTKTTELNGTTYYVEGINFNIYEAIQDENGEYEYTANDGTTIKYRKALDTDRGTGTQGVTAPAVASGTTGADGIYTSILLETGYYIIEEDPDSMKDDSIVSYPSDKEATYRVIFLKANDQVGTDEGDKKAGSDATFENPATRGKFVLKKVDQEGNVISGVTFQVYHQKDTYTSEEDRWELEYEFTYNSGTTNDEGIYESIFLEPGTYKLVEKSAPGYTIAYGEDNAVVFEIAAGEITGSTRTSVLPDTPVDQLGITTSAENDEVGLDNPILLANNEQGSLTVLKVGMYNGSVYDPNLQGVQFGLYTSRSAAAAGATEGEGVVAVLTTDVYGTCTWDNLDAGTYYVKEIGAVSGSEADGRYDTGSTAIRTVTIGVGEDVELVNATGDDLRFENNTTYGQFTIQKTDANSGTGLKGATFEIYTDADCTDRARDINGVVASITTEEDGTGTSPMLPGRVNYYLKEITPPSGYAAEDSDTITGPYYVTGNQLTDYTNNLITNRKLFSIEVTKMATGTTNTLEGAQIGLYTNYDDAYAAVTDETPEEDVKGQFWIQETGADGKVTFRNLRFGDSKQTYYVREISAPTGYDLNETVYEVEVAYDATKTVFTFAENDGVLYNDALGTVTIHKQGTWQGINDEAEVDVDLEGAVFSLYKVSACGVAPGQDDQPEATMTTDADGAATSIGLDAGWYALVETGVPEGFSEDTETYWVEIFNDTNTTTLYTADGTKLNDNVIMNEPDQGRFILYKYDGAEGKNGLTQLAGAVFRLEKEVSDDVWVAYNPDNPTFTMTSHEGESYYTSGYLDPGSYRITEVTAPTYSYTDGNGVVRTITFALLKDPIEFEITAGRTIRLDAYNSPQGTITLTKYGVDGDGETRAKLAGATYALYRDENCTQMISGSEKTTDVNGMITWTELDPGTYWIKETTTGEDAVNDQGYAISTQVESVTIEAGALIGEVQAGDLNKTVTFDDPSNAGKIRILKTNEDGTVKLSGATFEIYARDGEGWSEEPVETLTITDADAGAVSGFLSADADGTEYKIVETQAPNGYTLDGSLSELEQVVTVYPYHTPDAAAGENSVNCFVFANVETDSITGLGGTIHKQIREAGDGDDETEFTDETVTASESLLVSGYTVEFKLDGYGDGNNEKPVRNLTVTDNDITLQWLEQVNDGSTEYRNLDAKDGDYIINSVTVKASANADTNEAVGATVYVQNTLEEKADGEWTELITLTDISQDQTVKFDTAVVGVQVVYTNTLEGFTSDGLILNVTFPSRAEISTADDHEIRRVINQASISWSDTYLDNAGVEREQNYAFDSNEVMAEIPTYESKLPEIEITTEITDSKTTFYSGDEMNFRITAANMSDDDDEKILRQPVLSFKLPAHTTLDEMQWTDGFLVKKVSADGEEIIIPSSLYQITETETVAAESYLGGDSYTEEHQYSTKQYTIEFAESALTQLAPGEEIIVEFTGYISYEQKTGFDLVIPAYLSSLAKIPQSAENPLGLSFLPYSQVLYDNEVANDALSDNLNYVNDTDTAYVTNTNAVQLLKEIGVKNEDGTITWLSRGEVASVHPSEEIYYRLTLFNYSDSYVETAKLVDIFPCENDTYVLSSSEARGTDIPFGDGYEDMTLLSAEDVTGTGTVTWYSTDHNWSTRSSDESEGILQPMYYKVSDWSMGWTEMTEIDSDATALGMEIDFTNGGTDAGLESSGTYQIVISMKTPGYTADQISEYYGKYMDNSAAVSVVKAGSSDQVTTVPLEDMAEPNKVRATMELPTGSIGDYVWYDTGNGTDETTAGNGIQDEGEEPVEGMTVELWQTRYYEFNGSLRQDVQRIATTVTDQDGHYLFTGLACQYLNSGAEEGSADPSDYVGGEYYTYQVRFVKGTDFADYTFTLQYEGDDNTVDSDAAESGETGQISLSVQNGENGTLVGEENLTLDAGLVESFSLGDYVWLDTNCNGVQDEGESGVEGVPVFLYRVNGPDGTVEEGQNYTVRTTTDETGYYSFDELQAGYYVVEFDISDLRKDDGYTYTYDFTICQDTSAGVSGTDSDARYSVDEDGRIRRTDVITLTREGLEGQGIMNRRDPRWDAGLVVYSAIGGYVFDDADYDDLQSLYIPLEGTLVELYEVNPDGSLSEQPVASQTVGADGSYYFDHLMYGTEYKDYSIKFTYPEGYLGVNANADGDEATSDPALDSEMDSDVNLFDQAEDGSGADRTYGYISRIRLPQDTVSTTWDAGARKYSAIGDYVWIDHNQDGLQDEDETPVPDVLVVLQSRADSESEWEYAAYTTTDENGRYEFTGLESSEYLTKEYRVVFALAENTHITSLNSGTDSTIDSDAIGAYMADIIPTVVDGQTHNGGFVTTSIKPGYGESDPTWDAGIIYLLGSIGDYVWYDDDHDGIQDEDETGVADVPVVLEWNSAGNSRDEDAWVVIGETTTDQDGKYLFEGLEAGYYRVRFQIPEDYVNTRYNRGTGEDGNAVDSDASRAAEDRWYYSSSFYLSEGQVDLTWDAGIYKPITRTETITNREPINRVTRTPVYRTRTTSSRGTRTNDYTNVTPYVVLAVVGVGGCVTLITVRRRRNRKGA